MTQMPSELKNFEFPGVISVNEIDKLNVFVSCYGKVFTVHRRDNSTTARSYMLGLMKCEKNHTNIERMTEQIPELAYHQYHNFLSESKWDACAVNRMTALQASTLMEKCKSQSGMPTGLLVDESSHLKKGKASVGVSRQYAGVTGKVDNCQVAVYAALCNGDNTTLVGNSLFLPEGWAGDALRCDQAGIPAQYRKFETKPQRALALIKEMRSLGVKFDWVGGDGLYGHNTELTHALDDEGEFYVLDVHKDELIFLEEPTLCVPQKKSHKGPSPKKLQADHSAVRIDQYCQELAENQWQRVKVRKTTKGTKYVLAHTATVWHWDGKESSARRRTLIVTRTEEKNPKTKYSFSNGSLTEHTPAQYAYFQCARYWVERCFDDAKNELGLSGYQVRKWSAWQHHQALVMMALLYMVKEKIEKKAEHPLMSIRDTRILLIANIFCEPDAIRAIESQMLKRHKDRQKDIDRHYNTNDA